MAFLKTVTHSSWFDQLAKVTHLLPAAILSQKRSSCPRDSPEWKIGSLDPLPPPYLFGSTSSPFKLQTTCGENKHSRRFARSVHRANTLCEFGCPEEKEVMMGGTLDTEHLGGGCPLRLWLVQRNQHTSSQGASGMERERYKEAEGGSGALSGQSLSSLTSP